METLKFEISNINIENLKNNSSLNFQLHYELNGKGGIEQVQLAHFKGFYFTIKCMINVQQSFKVIVEGNFRTYWEFMHENITRPITISPDILLDHLFNKFNFTDNLSDITFKSFKLFKHEFINPTDDLPF